MSKGDSPWKRRMLNNQLTKWKNNAKNKRKWLGTGPPFPQHAPVPHQMATWLYNNIMLYKCFIHWPWGAISLPSFYRYVRAYPSFNQARVLHRIPMCTMGIYSNIGAAWRGRPTVCPHLVNQRLLIQCWQLTLPIAFLWPQSLHRICTSPPCRQTSPSLAQRTPPSRPSGSPSVRKLLNGSVAPELHGYPWPGCCQPARGIIEVNWDHRPAPEDYCIETNNVRYQSSKTER